MDRPGREGKRTEVEADESVCLTMFTVPSRGQKQALAGRTDHGTCQGGKAAAAGQPFPFVLDGVYCRWTEVRVGRILESTSFRTCARHCHAERQLRAD